LAEADANAEAIAAVEANEAAYLEAFLAKDLDAFMDTFTDDAVFIDETFGDHLEGRAAVRGMYTHMIKLADPDLSEELDLYVTGDGTTATSTWEWIGTNAYGDPFHLPLALIHEYRDGKIARETVYYASRNAYNQLMGI
jgi:steroid delta-isomerase-like uncharacterized protein